MSMPTKEAYNLLQIKNIIEKKGPKLPKNIMTLIGRYADKSTPKEIYEALKDFLKKPLWKDMPEQSGLKYYGLDQDEPGYIQYHNRFAEQCWTELSQGVTDSFEPNLNRVLDFLLISYDYYLQSHHFDPVLFFAIKENNLVLIKAFLDRRQVLKYAPPSYLLPDEVMRSQYSIYARVVVDDCSFPVTVLHLAAMVGNIKAYHLLMNAGATIPMNIEPLILAVARGHFKFMKQALSQDTQYPLYDRAMVAYDDTPLGSTLLTRRTVDGLLLTALYSREPHDQLITFLIEKGPNVYAFTDQDIEHALKYRLKDATSAIVTAIGLDRVLLMDDSYPLIELVGGYKRVCELTNTAETDPRALVLIATGILSQARRSMLTTTTSLEILLEMMDAISPSISQANHSTIAPIVKAFKRLHNRPWYEVHIAQPDPIEKDLSPAQRGKWFK